MHRGFALLGCVSLFAVAFATSAHARPETGGALSAPPLPAADLRAAPDVTRPDDGRDASIEPEEEDAPREATRIYLGYALSGPAGGLDSHAGTFRGHFGRSFVTGAALSLGARRVEGDRWFMAGLRGFSGYQVIDAWRPFAPRLAAFIDAELAFSKDELGIPQFAPRWFAGAELGLGFIAQRLGQVDLSIGLGRGREQGESARLLSLRLYFGF